MAWANSSFADSTLTYDVLEAIDREDDRFGTEYPEYQTLYPSDQGRPREPHLLQGSLSEENLFDAGTNFSRISIRNWSATDTFDWATSVCKRNDIPVYGGVNVAAFQTVSGRDLVHYSQQDFAQVIGPVYGPLFHREFQHFKLKEQRWNQDRDDYSRSPEPDDASFLGLPQSPDPYPHPSEDLRDLEESINYGDLIYASTLCGSEYPNENSQSCESHHEFLDCGFPTTLNTQDQWSSPLFPEDLSEIRSSPYPLNQNEWSTSLYPVDQNQWSTSTAQTVDQNQWSTSMAQAVDQGSSPNISEETPESSIFESIPTNTRRGRTRGPKSWEFLKRLLSDPTYNPSIIEWVDRERGVFRLVDKDTIACMWGNREYKGREKQDKLSYENFSRALRYYYPSKTLLPVMEKHLQYQFGPKVMRAINKEAATQSNDFC